MAREQLLLQYPVAREIHNHSGIYLMRMADLIDHAIVSLRPLAEVMTKASWWEYCE